MFFSRTKERFRIFAHILIGNLNKRHGQNGKVSIPLTQSQHVRTGCQGGAVHHVRHGGGTGFHPGGTSWKWKTDAADRRGKQSALHERLVQNIGAYGVEVESIIREVETIEVATGKPSVFQAAECEYGYRDSIFKHRLQGQYIVTAVVFCLSATPQVHLNYGQLQELREREEVPTAQEIREAVIAIRKMKLPEPAELGSAGSFFKNPVVPVEKYQELAAAYKEVPHYVVSPEQIKIPAAWLIEQCGWKGKSHGGAAVYEKQPLIIVNQHQATPQDIMELASLIQQSVQEKFQIAIQPEVNYI